MSGKQRSNASCILSASGDDNYQDEQMDIESMVFRSQNNYQ